VKWFTFCSLLKKCQLKMPAGVGWVFLTANMCHDEAMFYDIVISPIGRITLAADDHYLRELHLEGDRYFKGAPDNWVHQPDAAILKLARQELDAYFNAKCATFSVPVAFAGTDFQNQVWRELQKIPAGQTTTYAELATRIGKPKAVRAVGTAVGRNPICVIIPCHRVLASSGGLGGYVAGLDRKQHLLDLEKQ
jgi:methylated-DNA-[protein]-cysteine S-methyltransferase